MVHHYDVKTRRIHARLDRTLEEQLEEAVKAAKEWGRLEAAKDLPLERTELDAEDVWDVVYRRRGGVGVAMIRCNGEDLLQWEVEQNFSGGDGDAIGREVCSGVWDVVDVLSRPGRVAERLLVEAERLEAQAMKGPAMDRKGLIAAAGAFRVAAELSRVVF